MAFVYDQGDPSGLGMYSKAGRFTSEKYSIFQRKDEILSDHKKTKKVSAFPSLSKVTPKTSRENGLDFYIDRAKAASFRQ